tara:strand:- start:88 stop:201 length:114 start_codon:yes stop_codon:yes gene_type:complete
MVRDIKTLPYLLLSYLSDKKPRIPVIEPIIAIVKKRS